VNQVAPARPRVASGQTYHGSMNVEHEQANNRARSHGGRPPPNVPAQWATNGTGAGTSFAGLPSGGCAGLPGGETDEVELTLTPPSRYRSLLVPLDGSSFGEHALPLALGIARRSGASVILVHVHPLLESAWDSGHLYSDSGLDASLRQRKQAYLRGLMRRLAKATSVPVVPLLAEGREVAPTLCEVAGADTDLVVMATHRRSLLGRLWHGCVADALLRGLTAPLLLVRGHHAPVDLTGDPVPRHVLIPLDGSEAAEQILEPALDLGTLTGADHTLLRVARLETDYPVAYGRAGPGRPPGERTQAEEWNYLRSLALRVGGEAARVHPRLLFAERSIAASVLWYAEQQGADLIALATRGQGSLSRLFRGSVADRVARRATTPVLVVRATE
jgi:nucleotide-binding universal stress UspA family protein